MGATVGAGTTVHAAARPSANKNAPSAITAQESCSRLRLIASLFAFLRLSSCTALLTVQPQ